MYIFKNGITTKLLLKIQQLHCRNNELHYNTHPFNGPFAEARDSEWQWHQLGHMQVCISLQTDNHASTPTTLFLQAGCPSCRPANSIKALKAK